MSADLLFTLCNLLVLPGWLLLLVLPGWRFTLGFISSGLIPGVLGLAYITLFFTHGIAGFDEGGFGSLSEVMALFTQPYLVTLGWIHYLAFDLFVGCWEVQDARRQGIPHWLVIPCLVLTFMLGPAGLVLYLVLRAARTRNVWIYN